MHSTDARERELFHHMRRVVDLLEDIGLRPLPPQADAKQNPETKPSAADRPGAALPQKMAYSIKEVIQLCAISRSSLYCEIGEGRLRTVKRGHRSLVLAADLQKWLSSLPASRS